MRKKFWLILWIALPILACAPLAGEETTTLTEPSAPAASTDAPTAIETPANPKGRCGDGVCDEREKENRARCPEDCGTSTPFPTLAGGVAPTPEPGQTTDVVFAVAEGVPLTLDVYLPETGGPHPAVILIHGGAFTSGDKASHAGLGKTMVRWGYAGFAINYRLAPDHPFPAAVADVQCAVAWVREHADVYNIDPDRIALLGTSAGGHLAALAAVAATPSPPPATWEPSCGDPSTSLQVQAFVSLFGPLDLAYHNQEAGGSKPVVTNFLGQECQDAPDLCAAASPITYVSADAPPALLIHGTADDAVHPENSERMAEALQAAGAEAIYLPIEGAEHSFIFKSAAPEAQEALAAIEAFLADVLADR